MISYLDYVQFSGPCASPVFFSHSPWRLRNDELRSVGGNTTPARSFVSNVSSLPLLPGEDTIVFIKPAHLGAMDPVDCGGNAIVPCIMTVSSTKLMATESPVFSKQFEPRFQQRLMRRHGMTSLPRGIDWILDLTPPEDGDEIGPQIVLLSLTPGLVKWASVADGLGVPRTLVKGHDDACRCDLASFPNILSPGSATFGESQKSNEVAYESYETSWNEYSQTRHLRALVRLMLVAKGNDLVIDSAPRLWTMVGLADILGCPAMIQDEVLRWLAEDKNRNFIVYLPEEALVIGHKMKLPDVIRSAFVILVNELALDLLAKKKEGEAKETNEALPAIPDAKIPEYTVFGRKRNIDVLDDDLQSMVQEAARRWAEKVREAVSNVFCEPIAGHPDIYTIFRSSEWHNLNKDLALVNATPLGVPGVITQQELVNLYERIVYVTRSEWAQHIRSSLNATLAGVLYDTLIQPYMQLGGHQIDLSEWNETADEFSTEQKFLCSNTWRKFGSYGPESWSNRSIGKRLRNATAQLRAGEMRMLWDIAAEFNERVEQISPVLPHFNLNKFSVEVQMHTNVMCSGWLEVENDLLRGLDISGVMVLNLEQGIFGMLPIFADGNDDETGGVYGMEVPDTELGPIGPGPAFRTGTTQFSEAASYAPSDETCTATGTSTTVEGTTTANASRDATNPDTDIDASGLRLRPRIAPSDGGSVASGTTNSSIGRLGQRIGDFDLFSIDEEGIQASPSTHLGHNVASDFKVCSLISDDRSATMSVAGTQTESESIAFSTIGSPIESPNRTGEQTLAYPPSIAATFSTTGSIVHVGGSNQNNVIDHDSSSEFDFAEEGEEDFGLDDDSDVQMANGNDDEDDDDEAWDLMDSDDDDDDETKGGRK